MTYANIAFHMGWGLRPHWPQLDRLAALELAESLDVLGERNRRRRKKDYCGADASNVFHFP